MTAPTGLPAPTRISTPTGPTPAGAAARCAVHPGRLAVGECPVCGQPRCAADAAAAGQLAGGCLSCRGRRAGAQPAPTRAGLAQAWVAAALACTALSLVGGVLGLEYVGAEFFSVIWPGLVGLACGWAATSLGGRFRLAGFRLLASVYAVVSALYAFKFATDPFGPTGRWLPPVIAAVVGAWLWPGPVRTGTGRRRSSGRSARTRSSRG